MKRYCSICNCIPNSFYVKGGLIICDECFCEFAKNMSYNIGKNNVH